MVDSFTNSTRFLKFLKISESRGVLQYTGNNTLGAMFIYVGGSFEIYILYRNCSRNVDIIHNRRMCKRLENVLLQFSVKVLV